jgi:hypothetical protein
VITFIRYNPLYDIAKVSPGGERYPKRLASAYQEKISHANDCQKTDIHRSTKGVVFKASFGQHNATQTNEFLQILAA